MRACKCVAGILSFPILLILFLIHTVISFLAMFSGVIGRIISVLIILLMIVAVCSGEYRVLAGLCILGIVLLAALHLSDMLVAGTTKLLCYIVDWFFGR